MIRTKRPKIKISIDRTQMYCANCTYQEWIIGYNCNCTMFGELKVKVLKDMSLMVNRHKKCLEAEQ
jgi:hypothetical protein